MCFPRHLFQIPQQDTLLLQPNPPWTDWGIDRLWRKHTLAYLPWSYVAVPPVCDSKNCPLRRQMTACICCETKSNDTVFITICKIDTDLWSSLGIILMLTIEVGFTYPTAQTNTVLTTVPPIDVGLIGSWSKISDVSKPRKYHKKMPIATHMQCRCGRFKRSRKIHVHVYVTARWHKPLTNAVVTKTRILFQISPYISSARKCVLNLFSWCDSPF